MIQYVRYLVSRLYARYSFCGGMMSGQEGTNEGSTRHHTTLAFQNSGKGRTRLCHLVLKCVNTIL
jgi:hypothetical protein